MYLIFFFDSGIAFYEQSGVLKALNLLRSSGLSSHEKLCVLYNKGRVVCYVIN